MKIRKSRALLITALVLIGFVYYYITLPAFNIHSVGFWFFIFFIVVFAMVGYVLYKKKDANKKALKSGSTVLILIVAVFLLGSILSSPIINASKYQTLMAVEERNFTEDIKQISYNEIPILDKDSAEKLGDRKMGTMLDMVSQFEVSNLYTQINYKGVPTRVTPLEYASLIKWITNRSEGIPAYIRIDMATQNVEAVKLERGMKYSTVEHFGRNIYRHIRFNFPTYIFDSINFEVDDEGTPYWICPVQKFNIGLFGGTTIRNVVIVNAITGEMTDYNISEVPTWVDRVFSANMLIRLYDYHGSLTHGYLNSVLGQKDSLRTTDGYNYIALEDDVWVYTGITSVSGDESNVGFVLMNQRTMETRYYIIPGATEYSAMNSAEGQVQHLNYDATFPLLLNIAKEPTYFIALKDEAGLVKKYAMVNVEKYQIVATGDSIIECEKSYVKLMKENGLSDGDAASIKTITGIIKKISQGVISGDSHFYIMLEGSGDLFDFNVVEYIEIMKYDVGDEITFEYIEGEEVNTVIK